MLAKRTQTSSIQLTWHTHDPVPVVAMKIVSRRTFVLRWAACLLLVARGGSGVIAISVPVKGFQACASACSLHMMEAILHLV